MKNRKNVNYRVFNCVFKCYALIVIEKIFFFNLSDRKLSHGTVGFKEFQISMTSKDKEIIIEIRIQERVSAQKLVRQRVKNNVSQTHKL